MPEQRFVVHIPITRILLGLFLTIVPVSLIGLYTITRTEQAMNATIGSHFRTIAETTAGEVSSFIHDRVIAAGALTADPTIGAAVAAANRRYAGQSEKSVEAAIQRLESGWSRPAGDETARRMLASPASRLLARYIAADRRFLRITLTDTRGAVVAATHKTMDYYQADEESWQAVYARGRGAVHLTDVLYDQVTQSYYIGLGVPVMSEDSNAFAGVLDALIEVSSIFPMLNRVQLGATARALLVKADGTIIAAPDVNLGMNLKSEEFEAAAPQLATAAGRRRGYLITTLKGGAETLVGYADPGLKASYGQLGWTVLVAQDTRVACAATRGVLRLILFAGFVGLALATVVVTWFSLHRRREYTDLHSPEAEKPALRAAA